MSRSRPAYPYRNDTDPKKLEERFWSRVDRRGDDECWLWQGLKYPNGYGYISLVHNLKQSTRIAHRMSYELLRGPIPEGLTLDHLCRVRACVNPSHLEPVPMRENVRRGNGWSGLKMRQETCIRGHNDWKIRPGDGHRDCRQCRQMREETYQQRKLDRRIQKLKQELHRGSK